MTINNDISQYVILHDGKYMSGDCYQFAGIRLINEDGDEIDHFNHSSYSTSEDSEKELEDLFALVQNKVGSSFYSAEIFAKK